MSRPSSPVPAPIPAEATDAPSTPPASSHRDQDLAWSTRSTPTHQPRPKSILKNAAEHPALDLEAPLLSDDSRSDSRDAEGGTVGLGAGGKVKVAAPDPNVPAGMVSKEGVGEGQEAERLRAGLSGRTEACLENGAIMRKFAELYQNDYHPNDNPDGLISLGVAENHLMDEEVVEKIKSAVSQGFAAEHLGYGDGVGSRKLQRALCSYFNDYFAPLKPVEPAELMIAGGCSALFDHIAHAVCSPGDAVLIPQPYYVAYTADFSVRTQARVEPTFVGHMDEAFAPGMVRGLQAKVDALREEGVKSRILVITNPNNPLGRTYPRETLLAVAHFARDNGLHLLVNEIYAQSVYQNDEWPEAPPFVSALSIDFEREVPGFDMGRLHVMYGMSKDFCSNGLRAGVLVSQHNPGFVTAMAGMSFFTKISSLTDIAWTAMLSDRQWLEWFLAENQRRLGRAMGDTRAWFKERGVEVSRSNGGNFFLVDLGTRLGKSTDEGEKEIADRLMGAGVYLGSGRVFKHPTPGWFRITFCQERGKREVALKRIEDVLGLRKSESVGV